MFARLLAAVFGLLLVPTLLVVTPAEAAKRPAVITASLTDVPVGSVTVISGRTVRAPRPVRIQIRVTTPAAGRSTPRWVPVSGEFIGRNGRFAIPITPPAELGNYVYRAWAPRWQGRRAWASAPLTIRVVRVGIDPNVVARTIPVVNEPAPTGTTRALDWGRTDTFYAVPGVTTTSCATPNFCVVGTATGKVFIDTRTSTVGGSQLGPVPIADVACPTTGFCMALDKQGRVYRYNGSSWWGPVSINAGHTSTAIGCATPNLCVAVDQEGFGVPYIDGTWWPRQAGNVEGVPAPGGFWDVSCGPGAIACALVSPAGLTTFVYSDNPSGPSPSFTRQFAPWAPETDRPARRGILTAVSCPTTRSCTAAHTEGQATWIDPIGFLGILPNFASFDYRPGTASEPAKKAVVGCRSEDSCLILDNKGTLYAGNLLFGSWNYGATGTVLTGANFAIDFSCPLSGQEACLLAASDGLHRITN